MRYRQEGHVMGNRKRKPSPARQRTSPRTRPQGNASKIRTVRNKKDILLKTHEELEQQIQERTAEFRLAIEKLKLEIADRKRVEESLHKNEERFRLLMYHANDAIIYIDQQGAIEWASQRAATLIGRPIRELLGRPFMTLLTPEAARLSEARLDAIRRGEPVPPLVELEVLRSDATLVHTEANVTNVHANGNVIGRLLVARDITDRKQAEKALRESQSDLAEAQRVAKIGSWSFDPIRNRVQWSDELQKIFGVDKSDFTGNYEAFLSRVHPDDRSRVVQVNQQARTTGTTFAVEYRILLPSGELKTIGEIGYASKDAEGNIVRLFGTAQDITERKRAEEDRQELYERLQASHNRLRMLSHRLIAVQEEERRHLACELHDEIGQTLTAAKVNVQQAASALGEPAAGTHLAESIRLLDHTLEQVRNLALDLRPSLLDDLGLVPTLRWLVDRHAQASEIAIQCDFDRSAVRAHPKVELACYRVAQEALTNTIRHAHASQVSIELRITGQELELTVHDNGVGFDLDDMLTRAREGKSIGLLGIQERAALVGGQVDIRSLPGNGTCIHARLPLGGFFSQPGG